MKKIILIFTITLLFITSCTPKARQSGKTTNTDSVSIQISDTLQKSIDTVAVKQPENKPDTAKKRAITPKKQISNNSEIKLKRCNLKEKFMGNIKDMEVRLFVDTVSLSIRRLPYKCCISSNKNTKFAQLLCMEGAIRITMNICNFPEELMKLDTSGEGIPVIISGKKYDSIKNQQPQRAIDLFYNLELTKIIITK